MEQLEEQKAKFLPLAPVIGDVLELYEYLIDKAKDNYLKLVPGGKFLQMEGGVTKLKRKSDVLPLTGAEVDYRIADGWVIPMLAAFRSLIKV